MNEPLQLERMSDSDEVPLKKKIGLFEKIQALLEKCPNIKQVEGYKLGITEM